MRLLALSLKVTLDFLSANLWESEIITWACQHQRPVLKAKLSPALQQANLQIILHSFFLFISSFSSFTHSLFLLFQFHLHPYSLYTHFHSSIHPSLHPSDQIICSFALSVPLSPSLSSSLWISSPSFFHLYRIVWLHHVLFPLSSLTGTQSSFKL